ncbi:MAG: division/cell wall cluster transcriptional repressor MraZ [Solirubrobacterales bacterium]|nr:division/cell wall cluster transcriptional repressor MraZ [Solirubrobacterales bacterium]
MAFHGTFDHSLDAKNRLTIPSKFRAALDGIVFLVRGPDPCVSVYPEAVYSALAQQSLAGLNPMSAKARRMSRLFYAKADALELDGAGRIMLGVRHLEHARLTGREAVIAGTGNCLEVWDRAAWLSYDADLTAEASDLTAELDHPA